MQEKTHDGDIGKGAGGPYSTFKSPSKTESAVKLFTSPGYIEAPPTSCPK